jgi:hypothetical protein
VNMSNEFPLDVGVQIYFVEYTVENTDTVYTVLDSLLSPYQNMMTSGFVNTSTGRVSAPSIKTIDQWLDSRKLDRISRSKRIFVRGHLTTANNGSVDVKIYSDYKLDIKVGIMAKLKQNIKFN